MFIVTGSKKKYASNPIIICDGIKIKPRIVKEPCRINFANNTITPPMIPTLGPYTQLAITVAKIPNSNPIPNVLNGCIKNPRIPFTTTKTRMNSNGVKKKININKNPINKVYRNHFLRNAFFMIYSIAFFFFCLILLNITKDKEKRMRLRGLSILKGFQYPLGIFEPRSQRVCVMHGNAIY